METKTGVSGNGNAPVFWRVLMPQRLPETTLPSYRWQGFILAYLGMSGSDYAGLLRFHRSHAPAWECRLCRSSGTD